MAHNIANDGSGDAMFYVGQTPWHGLGTHFATPPRSSVAIKAAHLDWEVVKTPLYYETGPQRKEVPNLCAVVRKDLQATGHSPLLGVVKSDYEIFQNRDAFALMDELLGGVDAVYHTAGALGDGERIWILAEVADNWDVVGDEMHPYLLLVTGHDGRTAIKVFPTSVRVVCQNTVNMSLKDASNVARAVHSNQMFLELECVKKYINSIKDSFETMKQSFSKMAAQKINDTLLDQYIASVFPLPQSKRQVNLMLRTQQDRRVVKRLFEAGKGNNAPPVKGTLWAAYNAITEFADHGRQDILGERRFARLLFGPEYHLKQRAYDVAMAIVDSN